MATEPGLLVSQGLMRQIEETTHAQNRVKHISIKPDSIIMRI
jgi:hypothetical protein